MRGGMRDAISNHLHTYMYDTYYLELTYTIILGILLILIDIKYTRISTYSSYVCTILMRAIKKERGRERDLTIIFFFFQLYFLFFYFYIKLSSPLFVTKSLLYIYERKKKTYTYIYARFLLLLLHLGGKKGRGDERRGPLSNTHLTCNFFLSFFLHVWSYSTPPPTPPPTPTPTPSCLSQRCCIVCTIQYNTIHCKKSVYFKILQTFTLEMKNHFSFFFFFSFLPPQQSLSFTKGKGWPSPHSLTHSLTHSLRRLYIFLNAKYSSKERKEKKKIKSNLYN